MYSITRQVSVLNCVVFHEWNQQQKKVLLFKTIHKSEIGNVVSTIPYVDLNKVTKYSSDL